MANWSTVDVVILSVVAFIAISTLVRLMINRRDTLLRDLNEQARRAKAAEAEE